MPCHPIKTESGIVAIVCTIRPRQRRCRWCKADAPLLCDGPHPSGRGTCDAPMCSAHAQHIGPDRDLCPTCAKQHRQASLFPSDA